MPDMNRRIYEIRATLGLTHIDCYRIGKTTVVVPLEILENLVQEVAKQEKV